jgi:hypothetical protein
MFARVTATLGRMVGRTLTYVGTCPVCGHRFACIDLATSYRTVLMHHNMAPKTRCPGAGEPPVAGSVRYQVPGRPIVHDAGDRSV